MTKRAALYARYSSEGQRAESISAQLRAAHDYCERKGYQVVKEFVDEATSAKSDDRPAFQDMISGARAGQFDTIVFHKIDRNSRNEYDYYFYKNVLKKAGVSVEYVEQGFDDSPEGALVESMLVGMAAYYSRNLAREVMKGMKENAYQAKHNGGTPALGYNIAPDKSYVINEAEAAIVRKIFEMRSTGSTYEDILAAMRAHGYRTKRGQPFCKNSLCDLLRNPKYKGTYVFGRGVTHADGTRNSRKGQSAIIVENALPAIVDEATWNAVQDKIRTRRDPANRKRDYLLSGIIKCSCGAAMVGTTTITRGVPHYYYKCNVYHRRSLAVSDEHQRITTAEAEGALMDCLDMYMNDGMVVKEILDAIMLGQGETVQVQSKEIGMLDRRLKELESKEQKIFDAYYADKIDMDTLGKQTKALQFDREAVQERLKSIKKMVRGVYLSREQVRTILDQFRVDLKANKKEPEKFRPLIKKIVPEIVVTKEKIRNCIRLAQYWCGWPDSNRHEC